MNIAVITGASSGLGMKFLDTIIRKYPMLDGRKRSHDYRLAEN